MQYRLIRQNRKSIKILIKDGVVLIKAPKFAPLFLIEQFLDKYKEWIYQELRNESLRQKRFEIGEYFLYLGKRYKLEYANTHLTFDGKNFYGNNVSKADFIHFYVDEAKRFLPKRVDHWASRFNARYSKIKISRARRRWGSCSSKGNINLSYRLMMVPLECIDYVIVHELCHLEYMNHSKAFWNLVRERMSDFEARERRLRDFLIDDI